MLLENGEALNSSCSNHTFVVCSLLLDPCDAWHSAILVQLHLADNCLPCLVAVIKPIYGAASIGVVRVNNMAELRKTYKKVVKEMAGARIVAGALQQAEASDDDEPADGSAKPVRQEVSSPFSGQNLWSFRKDAIVHLSVHKGDHLCSGG